MLLSTDFRDIVSEEMKGLEDLIPGDSGASSSCDDAGRDADVEDGSVPPVPKGSAGGNPERERKLCG